MSKSIVLALAVFLCLGGSSLLRSQAFSVPLSDRVFLTEVTLPKDGKKATVEVRDGTMATIIYDEGRESYSVAFALFQNERSGRPNVLPLEVTQDARGAKEVTQAGSVREVILGVPVTIEVDGRMFILEVTDVTIGSFPNIRPPDAGSRKNMRPTDLNKIYGKSGGGICCVTCGALTVCSSKVSLDCGSCDSGGGYSRPAI